MATYYWRCAAKNGASDSMPRFWSTLIRGDFGRKNPHIRGKVVFFFGFGWIFFNKLQFRTASFSVLARSERKRTVKFENVFGHVRTLK